MGYTHYWYRPEELDATTWARFTDATRTILDVAAVELGSGDGTRTPEVGAGRVVFNGRPPNDYEPFSIDRAYCKYRGEAPDVSLHYFNFCKTGHRDYDLVVVAVLVAFKLAFGASVRVLSDGHPSEWSPGLAVAERVLGKLTVGWNKDNGELLSVASAAETAGVA